MKWIWVGLGVLVATPLVAIPVYLYAYHSGRQSMANEMVESRLATKEEVEELDNTVFNADKSGLCALLGGC